jgi:hypothetical protein
VWSVLFVSLFMSNLALAEQVTLVSETSTHDAETLGALLLAINPGQREAITSPVRIGPLEPIAEVARIPFQSSLLRVDDCRSLFNSRNTISLYMILSCYRI